MNTTSSNGFGFSFTKGNHKSYSHKLPINRQNQFKKQKLNKEGVYENK